MIYRSRPLFSLAPDFRELENRPLDDFSYADRSGTGVGTPWRASERQRRQVVLPFLLEGLAAIAEARDFWRGRRAMAGGFWLPSWLNDFRLVENAAAGSNLLVVERVNLAQAISLAQHRHLALLDGMGGVRPHEIAAVEADGGREIVELAEPLAEPAWRGRTRCSPLLYVRFASDELDLEYLTDRDARCRLSFTELPAEYESPAEPRAEVWLYRFTAGGVSARFAAWGEPLIAGGLDWEAADISHDAIVEEVELGGEVRIDVGSDDPGHFLRRRHGGAMEVEIYRFEFGVSGFELLYRGEARSIEAGDRGQIRVRCASRIGWDREVPALMYQRLDNHALFSPGNGLDPADWTVEGTVSAVGGRWVESAIVGATVAAKGDAQWMLFGVATVGSERRGVAGIDGNRLWLTEGFAGAEVGDTIRITAGYDRRIQTAAGRFGNALNFLGFPYMPSEHPAVEQLSQPAKRGGKKK